MRSKHLFFLTIAALAALAAACSSAGCSSDPDPTPVGSSGTVASPRPLRARPAGEITQAEFDALAAALTGQKGDVTTPGAPSTGPFVP